jgi:hypothetical protein
MTVLDPMAGPALTTTVRTGGNPRRLFALGRSTLDVILDHLDCRRRGAIDEDIDRNYDAGVAMLSPRGSRTGARAVRSEADELEDALPGLRLRVTRLLADGPYGYVEWTGRSRAGRIEDGADTFVVTKGRIHCQTTHYTVRARPAGSATARPEPRKAPATGPRGGRTRHEPVATPRFGDDG